MKEASGEASLTVVTIILIAGLLSAAAVILSSVMTSIQKKADAVTDGEATTINYVIDLD